MKQRQIINMLQDNYVTLLVQINPSQQPSMLSAPVNTAPNFLQAPVHLPRNEPAPAPAAPGAPVVNKAYTFKALKTDFICAGDYIIVLTTQGLRTGLVTLVHETPQIDFDSDVDYKWIVGKVDLTAHLQLIQREEEFKATLVEIERQKQREQFRKDFEENFEGSSILSSMFGSAVQNLNSPYGVAPMTPAQPSPVTTEQPGTTPVTPQPAEVK